MATSSRETVEVRIAEPGDAPQLRANCMATATLEQVREEIEENAYKGKCRYTAEDVSSTIG